VRDVLEILAGSVPWFCQILKLNGTECLSSKEGVETAKHDGSNRIQGKENGKDVEGLLIFAKRGNRVIGPEDVLNEFRTKRLEWENSLN